MPSSSHDYQPSEESRTPKRRRLAESSFHVSLSQLLRWHEAVYHPLDHHRKEIRVLRLLPNESLEHIPQGVLQTVSLDEAVFEAISYVWGDIRQLKWMTLNGHQVPIGANAHTALRYVRSKLEERLIWLDAVCIDQTNNDERNEQVLLMKEIFSKAKPVWLWLGPCTKQAERFMRLMEKLTIMQDPSKSDLDLDSDDGQFLIRMRESRWYSIAQFLSNSFWTRVWTLQEVVMSAARGAAIVRFGEHRMDYSDFEIGVRAVIKAGIYLIFVGRREFLATPIKKFLHLFGLTSDFLNRKIKASNLVYMHDHLIARDERDQIYGLLGIYTDLRIRPDYEKAWPDVYMEATLAIFEQAESLDSMLFHQLANESDHFLPSWTIEWRPNQRQLSSHTLPLHLRAYNACADRSPVFKRFEPQGKRLLVMGHKLFQVDDLLRFESDACSGDVSFEMLADVKSWMLHLSSERTNTIARDVEEDFGRMLFLDVFIPFQGQPAKRIGTVTRSKPMPEYIDRFFDLLWRREEGFTPDPREEEEMKTCFTGLATQLQKACFAVGPSGQLCLLTDKCCEGDFAFVLAGCSMPVILRPVRDSSPRSFRYIGPAYVHGAMDGECVAESAKRVSTGDPDAYDNAFEEIVLV